MVVHTGGAEAGHYYSYAQSSDGKWWEFNDTDVSPFDPADLDQETFGGRHIVTLDDPHSIDKANPRKLRKECDKPFNAYLLIYKQRGPGNPNIDRKDPQTPTTPTAPNKEKSSNIKVTVNGVTPPTTTVAVPASKVTANGPTSKKAPSKVVTLSSTANTSFLAETETLRLPAPIQSTIWKENLSFLSDKNVFDFDYLTFLWQTVQLSSLRASSSFLKVQGIEIATCFVFEIVVRAKDNGTFPRWMRTLYKMYQVCWWRGCWWFL